MFVTSNPLSARIHGLGAAAAVATAVIVTVIGSTVVNTVIAVVAHAAGASQSFQPLQFGTYTALTVIGVVFAALAWQLVRARSGSPATVLRRLVPAVLALSFIPDLLVGATTSQVGTTWGAVAALMCMHLVVGTVSVAVFATVLPVQESAARAPDVAEAVG